VDWHPNKRVNMSNDPAVIEKMLLQSLSRLKREQIDIYMIHWPDPRIDIRRPMEVLKKYHDQKIIKHIGLCNSNPSDLNLAQEIAPVTFLQSELNALSTKAFEHLDWKNYFTMSWGTFDKGILSGRVTADRKFDASDARSWAPWWNKKEVNQKNIRVNKLQTILQEHNISLTQFALHFNLNHYGINCALIGLKSSSDLVQASSHLQKNISESIMREVLKQWDD
jgi:myo-inositol catabolism protein IolS